jgi:tRNA(fMet)-specific endonuclease VapC
LRRYLLDTNTVSHALRGHPKVMARMTTLPMADLRVSVITEAELRYGLARRPGAVALRTLVDEFLHRVDVLAWDRDCATHYGLLRANLAEAGKTLAPLDLLIASQALACDCVLVSNDQAFMHCSGLAFEDWTR